MNLLRAIRHDAVAPVGLFLKFNPNACDVGLFTLDQRIGVLVKRCNAFLSTPVSFFAGAAIRLAPVTSRIKSCKGFLLCSRIQRFYCFSWCIRDHRLVTRLYINGRPSK